MHASSTVGIGSSRPERRGCVRRRGESSCDWKVDVWIGWLWPRLDALRRPEGHDPDPGRDHERLFVDTDLRDHVRHLELRGVPGTSGARTFIEGNREALAKDAARGSGETITTLSAIAG